MHSGHLPKHNRKNVLLIVGVPEHPVEFTAGLDIVGPHQFPVFMVQQPGGNRLASVLFKVELGKQRRLWKETRNSCSDPNVPVPTGGGSESEIRLRRGRPGSRCRQRIEQGRCVS